MTLERLYYAIAAVAFVLTGSQALGFFDAGFVGGTVDFWDEALTTGHAARFLAFDISMLGLAVFVFMWVESRKLGLSARWYVAYVLLSIFVGISTFVPLFLAHRERLLASAGNRT